MLPMLPAKFRLQDIPDSDLTQQLRFGAAMPRSKRRDSGLVRPVRKLTWSRSGGVRTFERSTRTLEDPMPAAVFTSIRYPHQSVLERTQ